MSCLQVKQTSWFLKEKIMQCCHKTCRIMRIHSQDHGHCNCLKLRILLKTSNIAVRILYIVSAKRTYCHCLISLLPSSAPATVATSEHLPLPPQRANSCRNAVMQSLSTDMGKLTPATIAVGELMPTKQHQCQAISAAGGLGVVTTAGEQRC